MTHVPRLQAALHALLHTQRVAALGTLGEDGVPHVSMVPYAINTRDGCLVLHVSGLAAHARNIARRPDAVSLLVMQPENPDAPVHDLPRVTLTGRADGPEAGSEFRQRCRESYLTRFPEAAPMTELGDFRFVSVQVEGARQIAGFGAARSVEAAELASILQTARLG